MKTLTILLIVASVSCCAVKSALAWNSVGHMVVAKLAIDQLEADEQVRLLEVLKKHPHYGTYLAFGKPMDVSELDWSAMRAANWPDYVRPRTNDPREQAIPAYSRPDDHFLNQPFIDPADVDFFAGKDLTKPDAPDIVAALKQRSGDLALKTASPADKAVAVCWIEHLIGDIHQPLHNVAYFNRTPAFQHGDMGGNKFGVKVNGHKHKLHSYWDEILGDDPNFEDDSAEHAVQIYQLAIGVAATLRDAPLVDADRDRLAKNLTFASWSDESLGLAKTVCYQKADGSGIIAGVAVPFSGGVPDSAPELGAAYAQVARTTAEARVVLAGKRLAARLKKLLPPGGQ